MRVTKPARAVLLVAFVWAGFASQVDAAPLPMTYQGQLKFQGVPLNGTADFRFSLWDDETAGTELMEFEPVNNVDVVNGLFTVGLIFTDNPATVLTGQARWLKILVATPSGGEFQPLSPRQMITPAPYAQYALNAPSWPWVTNGYKIYYNAGDVGIGTNNPVYPLHVAGDAAFDQNAWFRSAAPFEIAHESNTGLAIDPTRPSLSLEVDNQALVTLADGAVGIGTSNPSSPLHVLSTGMWTVYSRNTAATGVARGVYATANSTSGYGVVGSASANSGTTYGVAGECFSPAGYAVYGSNEAESGDAHGVYGESYSPDGIGVHGYVNAGAGNGVSSGVFGEVDSTDGRGVYGHATATSGWTFGVMGETESIEGAAVHGMANATVGLVSGVYGFSQSASGRGVSGLNNAGGCAVYGSASGSGWAGYFAGKGYFSGNLGLGTTSPAERLHVVGNAKVDGNATVDGRLQLRNSSDAVTLELEGHSGGGGASHIALNRPDEAMTLALYSSYGSTGASEIHMFDSTGIKTIQLRASEGGNQGSDIELRNLANQVTLQLDADVGGSGESRVITDVLEITGGSDLSEQFDVAPTGAGVMPGTVVCIDADHPGKLVVSGRAYDRTVAGVISGAGGVRPGMLMGQHGSPADGKHPIALTGRVYVWADASGSAIQPGDLLTTSNVPGHAMKVTDLDRAHGATLGKAMTALKQGRGLVLLLVTLH